MRFGVITAAVVFAFFLLASAQARAANPAFALAFRFDPVFSVTTPTAPTVYLDICDNPDCHYVARTATMNCTVQPVPPAGTPAIVGCMVEAVSESSYPDPNLRLLSHPMNLRVRMNNMESQIFSFAGGQPAVPQVFYNFVVAPGVNGFTVSMGQ